MGSKPIASQPKAAHVAKHILMHRHYCARFTRDGDWYYDSITGVHHTTTDYDKLVYVHLMTMTTRILKEFP